jgi:drug/metabolite transporter (DMT)-like permease
VAYALLFELLRRMEATRMSALFYLGPPVTMIMAWLAFGDTLGGVDIVGLLVVLVGIALVRRRGPAGASDAESP